MSPMQPVQVRRGLVWLALVAMLALPAATWFAGSRVNETSNQTDATAQLAQRVRELSVRTAADAQTTTAALCALRHDLELRVQGSRDFLRDHPNGIPGISAKAIREGIANQQRTIRALSGIDCQ